ncbi:hypothetical protein T492DRAFT_847081 [Pavlovales sp. CCMP2436]|nr:hypothetical protein T492DRAFT_847081 [Pavlovales sp. CCMP2436]
MTSIRDWRLHMNAIAFIAAGALGYTLWRGVRSAGPLRDAVEVREIAARPVEPIAAQLPDTSSTSSAAIFKSERLREIGHMLVTALDREVHKSAGFASLFASLVACHGADEWEGWAADFARRFAAFAVRCAACLASPLYPLVLEDWVLFASGLSEGPPPPALLAFE